MGYLVCALSLFVAVGCGRIHRSDDADGGPDDLDGGGTLKDAAAPDAEPQPAPTPSREFVGGAGRAAGPTYTIEAEIGLPVAAEQARGPSYTVEGNAAVKP